MLNHVLIAIGSALDGINPLPKGTRDFDWQ